MSTLNSHIKDIEVELRKIIKDGKVGIKVVSTNDFRKFTQFPAVHFKLISYDVFDDDLRTNDVRLGWEARYQVDVILNQDGTHKDTSKVITLTNNILDLLTKQMGEDERLDGNVFWLIPESVEFNTTLAENYVGSSIMLQIKFFQNVGE